MNELQIALCVFMSVTLFAYGILDGEVFPAIDRLVNPMRVLNMDTEVTLSRLRVLIGIRADEIQARRKDLFEINDPSLRELIDTKELGRVLGLLDACQIIGDNMEGDNALPRM